MYFQSIRAVALCNEVHSICSAFLGFHIEHPLTTEESNNNVKRNCKPMILGLVCNSPSPSSRWWRHRLKLVVREGRTPI